MSTYNKHIIIIIIIILTTKIYVLIQVTVHFTAMNTESCCDYVSSHLTVVGYLLLLYGFNMMIRTCTELFNT